MTFTGNKFYGGANNYHYTFDGEQFGIIDHDESKVWWLTSDDIAAPLGFDFILPDATLMRQLGWQTLFVASATGAGPINILNHQGVTLENLGIFQGVKIGLREKDTIQGVWTITTPVGVSNSNPRNNAQPTVSFGGVAGPSDTLLYIHETGQWISGTNMTVPGVVCSAADFGSGSTRKTFWRGADPDMYQYIGPITDTHTLKTNSGLPHTQNVAMSRTFDTSPGILSTSDSPSNVNKIYDVGGDSWAAVASIAGTEYEDNAMASAGVAQLWPFLFIGVLNIGSNKNWAYDSNGNQWFMVANEPSPRQTFAPAPVGLDTELHLIGGKELPASSPAFALNNHRAFDANTFDATNQVVWQKRPSLEINAYARGISHIDTVENRCTFGMGSNVGYPGVPTKHFQYDELTQAYTDKGFIAWGDKGRRESAWAINARV